MRTLFAHSIDSDILKPAHRPTDTEKETRRRMIHPKVAESHWLKKLSPLPTYDVLPRHTLVITPHPDDETLAAGGLIARLRSLGVEVSIIAVTDGENAYANQPGLGAVREIEQTNALGVLGVPSHAIHRLRIIDSDVTSFENQLFTQVMERASHQMHLLAPWRCDFHPDHEVCGRVAEAVSKKIKIPLTSYLFWTWHRGLEKTIAGLELRLLHLTNEEQTLKLKALQCHQSQLSQPDGFPILPENLLAPAYRSFEVYISA